MTLIMYDYSLCAWISSLDAVQEPTSASTMRRSCVCFMRLSRMWYMCVWDVPQTNAENSDTKTIYCAQHMHQSIDKSIQLPAGPQCDPIQMAQIVQQYCSTYSSAGHGCTLEWMLPTLFTSQSTTVTAYSLKTKSAKTGLLSAVCRRWP